MEILEIGIVGIILSSVIQLVKERYGVSSMGTKLLTVSLSLLLGTVLYFLSGTAALTAITGVLMTATTVWAYLMR